MRTPDLTPTAAERRLATCGDYIMAIKSLRARTGCTLPDAKRAVDHAEPEVSQLERMVKP
jgi:ribosomal protein L7/L12